MLDINNARDRVFFHELGHFVAQVINQRNHGGTGISEFFLKYNNQEQDYEGGVTPIKPPGWVEGTPAPIERLPQLLLSSAHGCIFESYFLNNTLDRCYEKHGQCDNKKQKDSLYANRKNHLKAEIDDLFNAFIEELKENKRLEELKSLAVEGYIQKEDLIKTFIDFEKLLKEVEPFVKSYDDEYNNLLKKISELLA